MHTTLGRVRKATVRICAYHQPPKNNRCRSSVAHLTPASDRRNLSPLSRSLRPFPFLGEESKKWFEGEGL